MLRFAVLLFLCYTVLYGERVALGCFRLNLMLFCFCWRIVFTVLLVMSCILFLVGPHTYRMCTYTFAETDAGRLVWMSQNVTARLVEASGEWWPKHCQQHHHIHET